MSQIEMIQSFARRHDYTVKLYGSCVTLFDSSGARRGVRRHVVMNGESRYTIVFQYETPVDSGRAEQAWEMVRESFPDVSITFGEIAGMWRNTRRRMRLFTEMGVDDGDDDQFDSLFSKSIVTLFNTRDALLDKYRELRDSEYVLFDEVPRDESVSPEAVKSLYKKVKSGGFADVAGLEELKAKLMDEVIWPLTHRDKAAAYKITPPSGMLLYGPPGCGKTFFAKKLAEETGLSFRMVYPSDIGGVFIHQTQGKVAELFEEARKKAPCIICFDEIDAMVPRRTPTPGIEYQNTEVNEFLVQMNNCGDKGIFVIGTTNNRDLVDPAAMRTGRLDYLVEIPLPDTKQLARLYETCLKGRPVATGISYTGLAHLSSGMTASDIAFVVNRAALAAARMDAPISESLLISSIRSCDRCDSGQTVQSVDEPDEVETLHSFMEPRGKKILS